MQIKALDMKKSGKHDLVRVRGIEPRPQAWEACVLPIYYTRI